MLILLGLALTSFVWHQPPAKDSSKMIETTETDLNVPETDEVTVTLQAVEEVSTGDKIVYKFEMPEELSTCEITNVRAVYGWNGTNPNNKQITVSVFTPLGGLSTTEQYVNPIGGDDFDHTPSAGETSADWYIVVYCDSGTTCDSATVQVTITLSSGTLSPILTTDSPGGWATFGGYDCP